jgi:hemin uptake protein HemP
MTKRPPYPTAMNDSDPSAEETHAARAERAPPRYSSEQLFAGARQLVIVHGDREYSLRLTATNKLILTA